MPGNLQNNVIYRSQIYGMKLRGKPKCPLCKNPLTFVYDDARKGHINEKCDKCKNLFMIDLSTMEVLQIIEDPN